jgi:hypothetical protein
MARFGRLKLERRLAWLLASMTASVICFVVYRYHDGSNSRPGSAPSQGQHGRAGAARLPAWVETPKVFDVSQVPDYVPPPFSLGTPIQLHPQLAQAMDRFLSRPRLTHKQAAQQNQAACPLDQANAQVNADQLKNDRDKWLAVDPDMIDAMRRGALDYLEQHTAREGEAALIGPGYALQDGERKPVRQGSRGLVLAAGNHRTLDRAIGCIKEMQRLGWHRGDIEVFHFEGELADEGQRQQLRALGATPHAVRAPLLPHSCSLLTVALTVLTPASGLH